MTKSGTSASRGGSSPKRGNLGSRPAIIGAVAGALGVVVGSSGPWISIGFLTINGLDTDTWGVVGLLLGAVSIVALLTVLLWSRLSRNLRWAVPGCWIPFVTVDDG